MRGRVPGGGIELLDPLQIGHGEADHRVAVLLQKVLAHRVGRDFRAGHDLIVVDDDRAPFVVLGEEAELVGKVGGVDLVLSQHAHEVGLRDVHDPLHVLGGIEAGFEQRLGGGVLVDAAERGDAELLALELAEVRGGAHALVVERLRHVDDRVAEARAIVTAVENDHERGALGDAVEQAGIRRHQRELKLARDHRRNGEGAVLEALGLDFEIELLEVALLARDEEGAPGDEGSFAHAHEIGRSARHGCAQRRAQAHARGQPSLCQSCHRFLLYLIRHPEVRAPMSGTPDIGT
jgi:hypothetical protein